MLLCILSYIFFSLHLSYFELWFTWVQKVWGWWGEQRRSRRISTCFGFQWTKVVEWNLINSGMHLYTCKMFCTCELWIRQAANNQLPLWPSWHLYNSITHADKELQKAIVFFPNTSPTIQTDVFTCAHLGKAESLIKYGYKHNVESALIEKYYWWIMYLIESLSGKHWIKFVLK